MTRIILLRAINAGVKLKMDALRSIATACGYAKARTYIASGNLLVETDEDEAAIRATLGPALESHVGGPVDLFVRTADDLEAVLAHNPFRQAPGNRVMALFLDAAPTRPISRRRPRAPTRRSHWGRATSICISPTARAGRGCACPRWIVARRAT